MKRKVFLLILFLALVGNRCFGLDAAFLKAHACVRAGDISQCEIIRGDTLSGFSAAAYSHGNLYKKIMGVNPSIADANCIYAGRTIIIPDAPSSSQSIAAVPVTSRVQSHAVAATATPLVNLLQVQTHPTIAREFTPVTAEIPAEDANVTLPEMLQSMAPERVPEVAITTATNVAVEPTPAPSPTSMEKAKGKPVRVTGYQFLVSGPDLRGPLQTQLVLFNSEEEKELGLPCGNCRIDLKPSLAISAKDGNTVIFIRLKKKPAQPFELLVGGINSPVDSTQIHPYGGKIPGRHPFLRTMATIGRMGALGGISLAVTGNPFIAVGVAAGTPIVKLGLTLHEKTQERKLAAAQAAVDKSKLALYRASLESNSLSKEIKQ